MLFSKIPSSQSTAAVKLRSDWRALWDGNEGMEIKHIWQLNDEYRPNW